MPVDYFKNARVKPTWQEMTRQAMAEEARKQAPMGWEVPVDQLYAPSSDVPISSGFALGGVEYDPIPETIASMVPWIKLAQLGAIGAIEVAPVAKELKTLTPKYIQNSWNSITDINPIPHGATPRISMQTPATAKEIVKEARLPKGMYRYAGESIPARELQLPNVKKELQAGIQMNPIRKSLMGTSIGQGESVREGDIADAIEAAIRAIRYERRLPKPKLPK